MQTTTEIWKALTPDQRYDRLTRTESSRNQMENALRARANYPNGKLSEGSTPRPDWDALNESQQLARLGTAEMQHANALGELGYALRDQLYPNAATVAA